VSANSRSINSKPPGLNTAAAQKYLGAFEAPRALNRRLMSVIIVLAVALGAMSIALMRMLPLHERIPYFVTVNPQSGAVSATNEVATRFTPSDASKRYFLNQWVTNLLTVDGHTRTQGLPNSYAFLRGAALGQWKQFEFGQYKPLEQLKQSPDVTVYPTILAIGFINDDSAAIRVALTSSTNNVKHLLVTVNFAILPPTTDAEVYRNPVGLWITHFEVTNEQQ